MLTEKPTGSIAVIIWNGSIKTSTQWVAVFKEAGNILDNIKKLIENNSKYIVYSCCTLMVHQESIQPSDLKFEIPWLHIWKNIFWITSCFFHWIASLHVLQCYIVAPSSLKTASLSPTLAYISVVGEVIHYSWGVLVTPPLKVVHIGFEMRLSGSTFSAYSNFF